MTEAPSRRLFAEVESLDRQIAPLRARLYRGAGRGHPGLSMLLAAAPRGASLDFRPLLFRCAFEIGGKRMRDVLPIALALQLANRATLVIDDILDHATRRDGRRCVHVVFGIERAILLSVLLKSFASRLFLQLNVPDSLRCVALDHFEAAWSDVHIGQFLDLRSSKRWATTEGTYLQTIRLTTGRLIEESLVIGGLFGGVAKREAKALARFGRALGVLHQMRDDLVEYWPTKYDLGRPAGEDLRERKPRLPLIYGLRARSPVRRELLEHLKGDAINFGIVRGLLLKSGAFEYTRGLIDRFRREATRSLKILPPSDPRNLLGILLEHVAAGMT